jgi:hypothetical protein
MKKLITALCLTSLLALTVNAAEGGKGSKKSHAPLTDEQKAVLKEMTDKYDANKDGKLDKEEKAKISAEDKEKMAKAGLGGKKKDAAKKAE